MNIFITGATGFIGKNFLNKLLSRIGPEDRVFSLVRRGGSIQDGRVQELVGSLEEIERFKDEISASSYFFHLAGNPVFGNKFNYEQANHAPTAKIVDILKKSPNLKNFIFISSIGAVDRDGRDDCQGPLTSESRPRPTSLYGQSKLKSEEYIRAAGIPFTILRPAWVYGRGMRARSHINAFVSLVFKESPIARFCFPGRVSLIHVDDLSDALVRCLGLEAVVGKIYFAAAEALPIGEIFRVLYEKIRKKSIRQIPVPRFSFVLKHIHRLMPLVAANLFLDYLWAEEEPFLRDFSIVSPKRFKDGAEDVIADNIHNGYWIITGANSGIGHELVRKLDAMNKRLVLIDKDTDSIAGFQKHLILKTDLGKSAGLEECVRSIPAGKIFCLINNAGVGFKGGFREISLEKIEEMVSVDVSYPAIFTKRLLERLVRDGSVIVNVTSSVAYNPLPGMAVYAAAKAFLTSWSEALSYELKESNKVITFMPSGTYTNFQKNAGVKVEREGKGLLSAGKVAEEIIKAVCGKQGTVVLGFKTNVMLGISKFLPRKFNVALWGKLFERLR